jgi:hypothetical protein
MSTIRSTSLRLLRTRRVFTPHHHFRSLATQSPKFQAAQHSGMPEGEKGRGFPPPTPSNESSDLGHHPGAPTFIGTKARLPEFNLVGRVILVSGGARGLGLTQAEALLEAGATVYVLDRLLEPSEDFHVVARRAREELGTILEYRQIDVTNPDGLTNVVEGIGRKHGRLDGLIAAAGINKERRALDYTPDEVREIMDVNVTGVFLTAQAVAKEMVHHGNGGSVLLIGSMSGSVANRVCRIPHIAILGARSPDANSAAL